MSAQRQATGKTRTATAPRGDAGSALDPVRPAAKTPAPAAKSAIERGKPSSEPKSGMAQRFDGIKKNYQDTVSELKKVNWPDRETTRNLTIVVIAISIVLGLLLGGVDFILQLIFQALP